MVGVVLAEAIVVEMPPLCNVVSSDDPIEVYPDGATAQPVTRCEVPDGFVAEMWYSFPASEFQISPRRAVLLAAASS